MSPKPSRGGGRASDSGTVRQRRPPAWRRWRRPDDASACLVHASRSDLQTATGGGDGFVYFMPGRMPGRCGVLLRAQ